MMEQLKKVVSKVFPLGRKDATIASALFFFILSVTMFVWAYECDLAKFGGPSLVLNSCDADSTAMYRSALVLITISAVLMAVAIYN
jgi:hypothetical protein